MPPKTCKNCGAVLPGELVEKCGVYVLIIGILEIQLMVATCGVCHHSVFHNSAVRKLYPAINLEDTED